MADTEEPHFTTLAERIAALNQQKNFKSPSPVNKRPPPPPPTGRPSPAPPPPVGPAAVAGQSNGNPSIPPRPTSKVVAAPALPRRTSTAPANGHAIESAPALPGRGGLAPPPLPSRRSTEQATSPALPPRRPSTQSLSVRRNSNSSEVSNFSNLSLHQTSSHTSVGSVDGQPLRKLPPTLDQAKLPPLPPTRRELEARAKDAAEKEAAAAAAAAPPRTIPVKAPLLPSKSAPTVPRVSEPGRPSLPPRLPTRPQPNRSPRIQEADEEPPAPTLPRRLPPPPSSHVPSPIPQVRGEKIKGTPDDSAPPPVPVSSRPSAAQIEEAHQPSEAECLICRDFSRPDAVAAQFPSKSLPRQDPVGYLAQVLCGSFPSPTDKARAIFTWCHHNIAYDVEGFFGGCIARGSPSETIFSGKAVCEGYARVYESIAKRAGLDCIVVGGHGKGYGYTPLAKDAPVPPRDATGHAWNAVKIDNGEWKLLDACWGAGSVGNQQYQKHFKPEMFTRPNDLFGLKHFPEDERHQFRSDGRAMSWAEYIVGPVRGEPAQWYGAATEEGLSEFTFSPRERHVPVHSGEVVRFQFSKICEHWTPEKNGRGKPMLLMVKIHGPDGRKDDLVPLDSDGFWWWADIPARDLGAPGQTISLYGLDTLNGQSARGVSKAEFLSKKGRCGMSWVGIAAWDLV